MDGLKDRGGVPDVARGGEAQAPHEPRGEVGEDVPQEVGGDDDVKALGTHDELHGAVVHDDVLHVHQGEVLGHLLDRVQEEPLGEGEDVGLVGDVKGFAGPALGDP